MPGTTPCAGLPYPTDTDPIDVAGDIALLALAADNAICKAGIGSAVGIISAYWDSQPGSPPPDGTLRCNGDDFDETTYPELFTHLGVNTLPDLRGRFLRGTDAVGGSFPGNGQLGGNADSPVAAHTHTIDGHTHTINHDHAAFTAAGGDHVHGMSHGHADAYTQAAGAHGHNLGNGTLLWWVDPNAWGLDDIAPGLGQTFGKAQWLHDGNHQHISSTPAFNGNTTQTAHSHNIDVPAYSGGSGSTPTTTNPTGVPVTNRNIPPFMNVTFLIQATPGL